MPAAAMAMWVGAARRVGGRRRRTGTATSSRGRNAGPGTTAEIRKWAQENGYEVSERGRIPAAVREAYAAAH